MFRGTIFAVLFAGLVLGDTAWSPCALGQGDDVRGLRLPWNAPDFQGYKETTRPTQPPPPVVKAAPQKYTVTIAVLPRQMPEKDPNTVVLMAHLPEDALLWFDDHPTTSKGMVRHFVSPPLTPGEHYYYMARIVWHEDGRWVSKTTKIPVQAGEFHCLYLTRVGDGEGTVAGNLSKLGPEDRKLAEAQKFCAVQDDIPLGAMGVPVKVMVKGQPVFLCCKECEDRALENPDKTLARVKELKEKNAAPSKK
jgi:uncharacterized protein (TIGR03000 family)